MDPVIFAQSAFPPLALGFFGLGTGYLIYGPQELWDFPKRDESVDRATGVWAIWMPGFCQLVAGTILFIGLSWFQVFTKAAPLYMAAFAFSAYGIHWFAMGWIRHSGYDGRPSAGMCVAYLLISTMGALVFFAVGDLPVGFVFVLLCLIYISDFFVSLGPDFWMAKLWKRSLGLWHVLNGLLLMYCAYAAAVNFSLGWQWPL